MSETEEKTIDEKVLDKALEVVTAQLEYHKDMLKDRTTLRDDFAAKAMQGLLYHDTCVNVDRYEIAEKAYKVADAMLKARDKTTS